MRKPRNRELNGLTVESVAAHGMGLARHEGKVIFIEKAIPGDVVDVRLTKNKKDYAMAYPVRFEKRSALRSEAFCEHFGVCGGYRRHLRVVSRPAAFVHFPFATP